MNNILCNKERSNEWLVSESHTYFLCVWTRGGGYELHKIKNKMLRVTFHQSNVFKHLFDNFKTNEYDEMTFRCDKKGVFIQQMHPMNEFLCECWIDAKSCQEYVCPVESAVFVVKIKWFCDNLKMAHESDQLSLVFDPKVNDVLHLLIENNHGKFIDVDMKLLDFEHKDPLVVDEYKDPIRVRVDPKVFSKTLSDLHDIDIGGKITFHLDSHALTLISKGDIAHAAVSFKSSDVPNGLCTIVISEERMSKWKAQQWEKARIKQFEDEQKMKKIQAEEEEEEEESEPPPPSKKRVRFADEEEEEEELVVLTSKKKKKKLVKTCEKLVNPTVHLKNEPIHSCIFDTRSLVKISRSAILCPSDMTLYFGEEDGFPLGLIYKENDMVLKHYIAPHMVEN